MTLVNFQRAKAGQLISIRTRLNTKNFQCAKTVVTRPNCHPHCIKQRYPRHLSRNLWPIMDMFMFLFVGFSIINYHSINFISTQKYKKVHGVKQWIIIIYMNYFFLLHQREEDIALFLFNIVSLTYNKIPNIRASSGTDVNCEESFVSQIPLCFAQ